VSGQLSVKPPETAAVLNYSYMIATSLFFEKIIFIIPMCCFIREVISLLEDSAPRHELPSSPYWPKFAMATKNSKIIRNTWNLRTLVHFSTYFTPKIWKLKKSKVSLMKPQKWPIRKKQVEGSCPPRHFRKPVTIFIDPYIQMSQFLAHMCISTCKPMSHSIWYHLVLKKMKFSFLLVQKQCFLCRKYQKV